MGGGAASKCPWESVWQERAFFLRMVDVPYHLFSGLILGGYVKLPPPGDSYLEWESSIESVCGPLGRGYLGYTLWALGGLWVLFPFLCVCVCVGGTSESLPSDILGELGAFFGGFIRFGLGDLWGSLGAGTAGSLCPGMGRLWEPLSQTISNRHLGGLPTLHDTPPPSTWSWSTTWAGTC